MIKAFLMICSIMYGGNLVASSETVMHHDVSVDIHNHARLQRGAKIFMNYCSGCHSLKYMRYNRMAKDMGLTTFDGSVDKDLLYNNLIFTHAKEHDPIDIAMTPENAREWFGVVPPDLSLTAREKGPQWIYNYLQGFYADASRPFGANNVLVPGVAMPNVLAPLQGIVVADTKIPTGNDLLLVEAGLMNQHQFDSTVEDLVTFLTYVGEPARLIRFKIGYWVLGYLFIFGLVAWQLKKAYWRKLN